MGLGVKHIKINLIEVINKFYLLSPQLPLLAAPARFTKKYSDADVFAFRAHSSAQLHTEVSDVSVKVTAGSGLVLVTAAGIKKGINSSFVSRRSPG